MMSSLHAYWSLFAGIGGLVGFLGRSGRLHGDATFSDDHRIDGPSCIESVASRLDWVDSQ